MTRDSGKNRVPPSPMIAFSMTYDYSWPALPRSASLAGCPHKRHGRRGQTPTGQCLGVNISVRRTVEVHLLLADCFDSWYGYCILYVATSSWQSAGTRAEIEACFLGIQPEFWWCEQSLSNGFRVPLLRRSFVQYRNQWMTSQLS